MSELSFKHNLCAGDSQLHKLSTESNGGLVKTLFIFMHFMLRDSYQSELFTY